MAEISIGRFSVKRKTIRTVVPLLGATLALVAVALAAGTVVVGCAQPRAIPKDKRELARPPVKSGKTKQISDYDSLLAVYKAHIKQVNADGLVMIAKEQREM